MPVYLSGLLARMPMSYTDYIPADILELYEVHDFKHAAAILRNEFPSEFDEICEALRNLRIPESHITTKGGSESQIPKSISRSLRPSWIEGQLNAKLMVDDEVINYDTHKIDYLKGRVAFDLEWNSKDQTYDRDLYAFRAFFDYNKISVGVLLTRSNELDPLFVQLGVMHKYGASTTQMGKLLPRLRAGRNGGCPVLVFGMTPRIVDLVSAVEIEDAPDQSSEEPSRDIDDLTNLLGTSSDDAPDNNI